MTIKAYHYSHESFDVFDLSKCDGFWFTDIPPEFEALENRYDGFTDYALIDNSKIKIVEWVKL